MTLAQARKTLEGPLQFGSQPQIEAREWLALFSKAKELGPDFYCFHCNGTGRCRCSDCETDHDCGFCNGEGYTKLYDHKDYSLPQLRELVREMEEKAA
jgi:hypothetical protein